MSTKIKVIHKGKGTYVTCTKLPFTLIPLTVVWMDYKEQEEGSE